MVHFRSRADKAHIVTPCSGETHTVIIALDGTIEMPHDQGLDDTEFALGGEHHECRKVLNAFDAALMRDQARRGISDVKTGVNRTRQGVFTSPSYCGQCRVQRRDGTVIGRAYEMSHFITPSHLGETYNAEPNLIKKFTTWIDRRVPSANRLPESNRNHQRLHSYYSQYLPASYEARQLHRLTITLRYLNDIAALFPEIPLNRREVINLAIDARNAGLRTEWLHTIATEAKPTALAYVMNIQRHRDPLQFIQMLAKARNANPREVTRLLNAGITSNLYTYAKYRASATDILTVYRATGGERTLASYLQEGISIPDAISDARTVA